MYWGYLPGRRDQEARQWGLAPAHTVLYTLVLRGPNKDRAITRYTAYGLSDQL